MAHRNGLHEESSAKLDALLRALRSGADAGIIATRARRVMCYTPPQASSRIGWLQTILPEPWHYTTVVAALQAASAGTATSVTTVPAGDKPAGRRRGRR